MVLKRDKEQQFQQFTDMLNEINAEPTLKLLGFAECEKNSKIEFEYSDSLENEIANSENVRVFTNKSCPVYCNGIGSVIGKLFNSDKGTFTVRSLADKKYKELGRLLELLDDSKDYVFVFSY